MQQSLIQFETPDQLFLPGLLYEPSQKTSKVALYLHGNGSSSVFYSLKLLPTLAEYLTKNKIAFFPFNNRGAHIIKKLTKKTDDKEERQKYGMAYELIKDCILDIDGAITHLKKLGYSTFYLIGSSTGANKIVVYHYYKPKNTVSKYILLSGGDDTGLFYQMMGKKKFFEALKRCKIETAAGKREKLVPKYFAGEDILSFQSLYDLINPEGDYNIFPFNEYMNNLKLSKKQLFKEYKTLNKPTLVIYGNNDEYCYGDVPRCIEILKKETIHKNRISFKLIEEADHGFTGKEEELAKTITEWLNR